MESVAQSIVTKFGQVLVEELKEIRGVGDKVVHLRDELATMNAVLRVISEAEQGSVDHVIREWEKQVHDLVYDAEDCTDIYSIRIIRPIPRLTADDVSGTPITFWARYLFARAKHFARYHYEKLVLQRTLAADINALLARTTIVSERRARYGIDQLARLQRSAYFAPVSAASTSASALHHISDPHQFVALHNDDLDQFVALNRDDDPQDHQLVGMTEQANALAWKIKAPLVHKHLEVFTIVGSGGLGKTALAMELCRLLDVDFPSQAQVSVSQEFDVRKDMKGLLVRMLGQILQKKLDDKQTNKEHLKDKDAMGTETHDNELQIEKMDVDDLSKKIKELLNRNRCLIVVDYVWSLPAWESICSKFPENNCGSRIIVTTRIEVVAKAASGFEYFIYHMKNLELKASKELFMKRVFGSEGTCPGGLQETMDIILKKM